MTDYVSLRTIASEVQGDDRLIATNYVDGKAKDIEVSNTKKASFAMFSARKSAQNSQRKTENINMARTVHNALVSRYGREGSTIFSKVYGNQYSGRSITASKLKAMFALGDKLEAEKCKSSVKGTIQDLSVNVSKKFSAMAMRLLGLAPGLPEDLSVRSRMLLSESYTDAPSLIEHNAQLNRMIGKVGSAIERIEQKLENYQASPHNPETADKIKNKLIGAMKNLKAALEQQVDANNQKIKADPYRLENVKPGFEALYNCALMTGSELLSRYSEAGLATPPELSDFLKNISAERDQLFTTTAQDGRRVPLPADSSVSKDDLKSFTELGKTLPERLKTLAEHLRPPMMTGREIKDLYKKARLTILNEAPWEKISRDITVNGYPRQIKVTSEIIPVKQLTYSGRMLPPAVNGISSMDHGSTHASNLQKTRLTDAQGNVLFEGVRHGVNCAFGIENANERRAANTSRAKEVVLAALESKPELLNQALRGETVTLPMVSTSLLSPALGVVSTDKQYMEEQLRAWRDICGADGVCEIQVPDGNGGTNVLKVRPQMITFNFGVNFLSHTKPGYLLGLGGGWQASDRLNSTALTQLNQVVNDYLVHAQISPKERSSIETLLRQVNDAYRKGLHRDSSVDPFAVPSRIALLAHKCGLVPLYNCKSGKDRTSQMDSAVKALAAELAAGGTPQVRSDETYKNLMKNMLFNAGNFELQKYNTGLEGYKIEYVSQTGLMSLFSVNSLSNVFNDMAEVSRFQAGGLVVPK